MGMVIRGPGWDPDLHPSGLSHCLIVSARVRAGIRISTHLALKRLSHCLIVSAGIRGWNPHLHPSGLSHCLIVSAGLFPPALEGAPLGLPAASNRSPRPAGRTGRLPARPASARRAPPRDQVVCRTPSNGILCAPSASGKTVLLVSMILEQYRGCFERVYIMSSSIDMDPQWEPVKEHIRKDLGVNTDREQCWWDEWDKAALRNILAQQKKITQQSKQLGMKKLYQVLIVLDDMADSPHVHRSCGS
ncbi:hypothetical protein AK812_SmicGene25552 [Symbiodinium microadriaticum]|uniref:Uncharacterized protein n=1 Tax=Symbiodinium microadriaticum TaxID=2951 RepID=A0A1Q9DBZ5_SYMMI|nr:hypothetical protein AK812_SmicGene25552 [Symbiodinium microadriaticum]